MVATGAPWTDCSPDIIFNVAQNCNDKDVTIVSEGLFEVRWDVPTQLDVHSHRQ